MPSRWDTLSDSASDELVPEVAAPAPRQKGRPRQEYTQRPRRAPRVLEPIPDPADASPAMLPQRQAKAARAAASKPMTPRPAWVDHVRGLVAHSR